MTLGAPSGVSRNKLTAEIRTMILEALTEAGGVEYLVKHCLPMFEEVLLVH